MTGIQWFAERLPRKGGSRRTEYRTYTAADFVTLPPENWDDEKTLVVLSSKSGSTRETLEAADLLPDMACTVVVFTQSETSQLAAYGSKQFYMGKTTQAFHSTFMLMQAFFGGFWAENGWDKLPQLLSSLRARPRVLVSAARQDDMRARADAQDFADVEAIDFFASGAGKLVSGAFGQYVLEANFRHAITMVAADHFFHSILERVDERTTAAFHIVTEDEARGQMERVKKFVEVYGPKVPVYDATDYAMEGVDDAIRPIVGPYVIEAALKRFAYHYSVITGRQFQRTRYMGKVFY